MAAADLCYDVFVAMVYIRFSSWCREVYWNNLVCEDLERSGSKVEDTGETMNTGGCLNLIGASYLQLPEQLWICLFEKLKANLFHSSKAKENICILIMFIFEIRDEQVEESDFLI